MTKSTLLLVNVATPLQVLIGWLEWSKLRWTVSAELHVQENGGETSLDPGWLRFTRYVDGSECRGTEHRGQGRDHKQASERFVLLPNHGTQIGLRRFRCETSREANSDVYT